MSSLPNAMTRLQLTEAAPAQWPMDLTQLLADFSQAPKLPGEDLPEDSVGDEIWTRHMRRCQPPLTCSVDDDEMSEVVKQWQRKFYSMEQDDEAELERLKAVLRNTPDVDEPAGPLAHLPPPPLSTSEHTNPFLLGWARSWRWQCFFLKACRDVTEEQIAARPWVKVSDNILNELGQRTGNGLFAHAEAVRLDLPLWSDDFSGMYCDQLPIVDIILLKTTVGLAHLGPTEAQYKWLKDVLGEPQWFRYPFSLREYKVKGLIRPGI